MWTLLGELCGKYLAVFMAESLALRGVRGVGPDESGAVSGREVGGQARGDVVVEYPGASNDG